MLDIDITMIQKTTIEDFQKVSIYNYNQVRNHEDGPAGHKNTFTNENNKRILAIHMYFIMQW